MNRPAITKLVAGILALTAVLLVLTWVAGGFVGLSGHGAAALILGALLSLAIGIGLMAVIFASSRSGHDQAVHDAAQAHFPTGPKDEER